MEFFRDVYSEANSVAKEDSGYTYEEVLAAMDERMAEASDMFDRKEYESVLPILLDTYNILGDWRCLSSFDDILGTVEYMRRFAWLCLRICYCYAEQEDYVSAFFYIDQVKGYSCECFMEWINMVVNGRRLDAYGTVEEVLQDPSEVKELFTEDEEGLKKLMDFLERRMGYLYIEFGQYEEARNLFTKMLDNPVSSDFAREELEYLDEIEKRE